MRSKCSEKCGFRDWKMWKETRYEGDEARKDGDMGLKMKTMERHGAKEIFALKRDLGLDLGPGQACLDLEPNLISYRMQRSESHRSGPQDPICTITNNICEIYWSTQRIRVFRAHKIKF